MADQQAQFSQTFIERAKREVPGFTEHYKKFERQTTIGGYAPSGAIHAKTRAQ